MSLILNIDTALETAGISVAQDGSILASRINTQQKEHASFLHIAAGELLKETGLKINQVDAVAVTSGPGSYTGLRVGLASAKGLCFAANKPLIMVGTLPVLSKAAITSMEKIEAAETFFCPMIDARRMEIYTAVYDVQLQEIVAPCAMILTAESFSQLLETNRIIFFGSGASKWKEIVVSANAGFIAQPITIQAFAALSYEKFLGETFTDLAYSEPLYLKEFYTP